MNSVLKKAVPFLILILGSMLLLLSFSVIVFGASTDRWQHEWPRTDFTKTTVDIKEIDEGGPGKDGIPSIDRPRFIPVSEVTNLKEDEPVIGVVIGGDARAYPLRILIWHEIVNDVIADTPVTVTYCPLCNTSIVFDRRLNNQVLNFGTTGNVRHSDLVMYDRQTESWWQQYDGTAIVGELAGQKLTVIPSRLESFKKFLQRAPSGLVLVPNNPRARKYGANPYVGYDKSPFPFLYKGLVPKGVVPMMRVVAVNDFAFTLPLVRSEGLLRREGMDISWSAGQKSALNSKKVYRGREVGNIVVQRDGKDIPYVVTFAFAFFAFNPTGTLYTLDGSVAPQAVPNTPK